MGKDGKAQERVRRRYDIQSGAGGTFIVRKDGPDWTKIAAFIPHEYDAQDESTLGNADLLADALEAYHRANQIHNDSEAALYRMSKAALRHAGRLP